MEGQEFGKDTLCARLFRARRRQGANRLRLAVAAVAFAEMRILVRRGAIVVERRLPEQARVRHHAGGNGADFAGVACATGFRRNAEVTRVYEFDVLRGFLQPLCVEALACGAPAQLGIARLHVRFFLYGVVFG